MAEFKQGNLLITEDKGVVWTTEQSIIGNADGSMTFNATSFSGIIGMEQHGDEWHNVDYALNSKVDTASGTLQDEIDNLFIPTDFYSRAETDAISGSLHQEILDIDLSPYATTAELSTASGILNSKIDTTSGTLQSEVNGKAPTIHTHDDRYYTEGEVDTISGALNIAKENAFAKNTAFNKNYGTTADTVASGLHLHDDRYYTEAETDALIAQTIYTPSIVTLNTGTYVSGNVASVQTLSDSDVYRVREATGTPGYNIEFTISGVASFNRIWLRNYYEGSASHIVNVELYNTTTSGWDMHATYNGAMTTYQFIDVPILDDVTKHIAAGVVRLRLWHIQSGSTSHYENIDFVAVVKAGLGATGSDHGALTGLGDDDHPQYLDVTRGDARYYTETEVDTISGNLNTSIGTKAATSHAVNASTYGYGDATLAGHLRAGTGLTTTTGTIAASFGATASTICVGNDARLSDARTPVSHAHGNITNTGYIGSTATLPLITTTGGLVTVGSFSNAAGTFCVGNDARLSDARTPVSHNNTYHSATYIVAGDVNYTNMNASSSVGTGASQVAKGDHLHDDRYYTETELNAGQLNNLYYTETEVNTISGAIVAQIPIPKEEGVIDIVNGSDTVSGTFAATQANANYILNANIQNLIDADASSYTFTITAKTTAGFVVKLSTTVDSGNYKLNWRIGGLIVSGGDLVTASGVLQTAITNISSLTYSPANLGYSSTATTIATAGETLAFGNVCYLKSDGKYWKSCATASGSGMPVRAMALATISGNTTGTFMVGMGYVRNDSWTWTTASDIYTSTTSGTMTQTVPGTAGNVVQLLGYATASGTMMFNPDSTYIVRA